MQRPRLVANSLILLAISSFVLLSPTERASARGTAVAVTVGAECGICFYSWKEPPDCPNEQEQEFHCIQQCEYGGPGECMEIEEWEEYWTGECDPGEWTHGWECGVISG